MTDVITVNPFIEEDVKRVLSFIGQYPDDEFVFRMPMTQNNKISMDMVKVEQVASMRTYSEYVSEDLNENSYVGFGDEDPILLALVELFKTKEDVDVKLPMGFT